LRDPAVVCCAQEEAHHAMPYMGVGTIESVWFTVEVRVDGNTRFTDFLQFSEGFLTAIPQQSCYV